MGRGPLVLERNGVNMYVQCQFSVIECAFFQNDLQLENDRRRTKQPNILDLKAQL